MGHISTRDMFEILSELRTTEGKLDDLMRFAESDLVKPVRCRECKWYVDDGNDPPSCENMKLLFVHRRGDFYCADGERRESE